MKDQFRIEDIQRVCLNGRNVKLFKAYEFDKNSQAYIFCGQFEAPVRTPNKNLLNYIGDEDEK